MASYETLVIGHYIRFFTAHPASPVKTHAANKTACILYIFFICDYHLFLQLKIQIMMSINIFLPYQEGEQLYSFLHFQAFVPPLRLHKELLPKIFQHSRPSDFATCLVVSNASLFPIVTISSTILVSITSGMNPAPIPCICEDQHYPRKEPVNPKAPRQLFLH